MPAPKTILAFPAALAEPLPHIHVDDSDFELPTDPRLPPPERPTSRPSAPELAALVDATREPPAWLGEPQWSADPVTGRLVLVAAYRARQLDDKGNVFVVECPIGVELEPPATRAQARAIRTALVSASLRVVAHAWITHRGAELMVPLDDQWRNEIVTAFRDGDTGARVRG